MIRKMGRYKFEISNLNLYYGDFRALRGINFNIPANEITAFIGPSGCGKTTLLRTLNRMNDLVEGCRITGKVLLDGEDIYGGGMDVNLLRKRVGMVFQKPNPFPMSVYDNAAFGPRTHGIRSFRYCRLNIFPSPGLFLFPRPRKNSQTVKKGER